MWAGTTQAQASCSGSHILFLEFTCITYACIVPVNQPLGLHYRQTHLDDHTRQTTDTLGSKPFYYILPLILISPYQYNRGFLTKTWGSHTFRLDIETLFFIVITHRCITCQDGNVFPLCRVPIGVIVPLFRAFISSTSACGILSCVNAACPSQLLVSSEQTWRKIHYFLKEGMCVTCGSGGEGEGWTCHESMDDSKQPGRNVVTRSLTDVL